MLKILTLIGARPQFIKASAISRAIKNDFSDKIKEVIVHSGQHYDENMSSVFFEELKIPNPNYIFKLGGSNPSNQTAEMLAQLDLVLQTEEPDAILVYGDTNTTLVGALASSKKQIPLIHVEAGLRSFNKRMPEEVNRVITDHCSSLLFCPTLTSVENLQNEGIVHSDGHCSIDAPKVYLCGDIMYDNSVYFSNYTDDKIFADKDVKKGSYILFTLHRQSNTDDDLRLRSICEMMLRFSQENKKQIVFPIHPRTRKSLRKVLNEEEYSQFMNHEFLKVIPPVSFLEMITLELNSELVVTDSGGVQKEAYFFEKPCLILRSETEWVEIVEQGCALLVDSSEEKFKEGYQLLMTKSLNFKKLFGDAKSANYICNKILQNLN